MIRRSEKLNKNHCQAFSPFHLNHNVRSTFSSSSFHPFVAPASATHISAHTHTHTRTAFPTWKRACDGWENEHCIYCQIILPLPTIGTRLPFYTFILTVFYIEYETQCSSSRQNLPSPQYLLFNSRARVRGTETIPSHLSALACVYLCSTD